MLSIAKRSLIVLTGVLIVLAPAAQASVILAPSSCMPMMMQRSGPMPCCGSSCDCEVETQKEEFSFDLPTSAPKFELSSSPFYSGSLTATAVSSEVETRTAEESPPSKDPLYQVYSDYRL